MPLHQLPLKRPLEDGLPQPFCPGEVGRQRPFQFLHHRQPPFHFGHDATLFREGWYSNRALCYCLHTNVALSYIARFIPKEMIPIVFTLHCNQEVVSIQQWREAETCNALIKQQIFPVLYDCDESIVSFSSSACLRDNNVVLSQKGFFLNFIGDVVNETGCVSSSSRPILTLPILTI
jgi:hypothetical protein